MLLYSSFNVILLYQDVNVRKFFISPHSNLSDERTDLWNVYFSIQSFKVSSNSYDGREIGIGFRKYRVRQGWTLNRRINPKCISG